MKNTLGKYKLIFFLLKNQLMVDHQLIFTGKDAMIWN